MRLYDVIPATGERAQLACETRTMLKDPKPVKKEGMLDLTVCTLPTPGADLEREFFITEVRRCP